MVRKPLVRFCSTLATVVPLQESRFKDILSTFSRIHQNFLIIWKSLLENGCATVCTYLVILNHRWFGFSAWCVLMVFLSYSNIIFGWMFKRYRFRSSSSASSFAFPPSAHLCLAIHSIFIHIDVYSHIFFRRDGDREKLQWKLHQQTNNTGCCAPQSMA